MITTLSMSNDSISVSQVTAPVQSNAALIETMDRLIKTIQNYKDLGLGYRALDALKGQESISQPAINRFTIDLQEAQNKLDTKFAQNLAGQILQLVQTRQQTPEQKKMVLTTIREKHKDLILKNLDILNSPLQRLEQATL